MPNIAVNILPAPKTDADLKLSSTAFEDEAPIPPEYTAYHDNLSPALSWAAGPEGTKSFALLVEDPDAPVAKPFVHWVVFNLPPDLTGLPENVAKEAKPDALKGGVQGYQGLGKSGYFGPRPPDAPPHRYYFQLFALDDTLDVPTGADRDALVAALRGHVLAQDVLMGSYQKGAGGE
ncbi:YbhB/YbcL family Raf kinase inhibitor-like protein [Methyloligella sp. GL2]|nr:YbhB/YbcL family Raf kinase inhibitor-like protein [Methyloligella sp. GL2]